MADRRMLLLLDDAAGHEQVRPLLPATGGVLVLITCRRRMAALEEARSLTLGTLATTEAEELLNRLAGEARREDPTASTELVSLCGCLPLAIGLLAGRLRSHRAWTVRHLTDLLRSARAAAPPEVVAACRSLPASVPRLAAPVKRVFKR